MKSENIKSRFFITIIIALYLTPLIFFSFYSMMFLPKGDRLLITSVGLFICFGCAAILYLFFLKKEKILENKIKGTSSPSNTYSFNTDISSSSIYPLEKKTSQQDEPQGLILHLQQCLSDSQEEQKSLNQQMEQKITELTAFQDEHDKLQKQFSKLAQEFSDYKTFSQEQLQQKGTVIQNLQYTIDEQRSDLDIKQEKIFQFESKIRDLSYEIKTLLQLNESESSANAYSKQTVHHPFTSSQAIKDAPSNATSINPIDSDLNTQPEIQVRTLSEANVFLKKCIDIAQKFAGASYYPSEHGRLLQHNYAIDLRRLFDSLRNETAAIVLVYSSKEDKLLFVNNQTKNFFGWNPEKFIQDFSSITQLATQEWKHAISQLQSHSETYARMLVKTKSGHDVLMQCMLKTIPAGLFKSQIIGIIFPAVQH